MQLLIHKFLVISFYKQLLKWQIKFSHIAHNQAKAVKKKIQGKVKRENDYKNYIETNKF